MPLKIKYCLKNGQEKQLLALGKKPFSLRPLCLDRYLRGLSGLSETAREVYWLHYSQGYLRRTMTTALSIADVANALNTSRSAISRAYQQLSEYKLVRRQATRTQAGGQGTSQTDITLPEPALRQLLLTPDRAMRGDDISSPSGDPVPRFAPKQPAANDGYFGTPSAEAVAAQCATPSESPVAATEDGPPALADGVAISEIRQADTEMDVQREALHQRLRDLNNKLLVCAQVHDLDRHRQLCRKIRQIEAKLAALTIGATANTSRSPAMAVEATAPAPVANTASVHSATSGATYPPVRTGQQPALSPKTLAPARTLNERFRAQIGERVQALSKVSAPHRLIDEITWSLERGAQRHLPPRRALNAAISLVKTNCWRTPCGFPTPRPKMIERGYPNLGERLSPS